MRFPWFVKSDLDGFFGLFTDNLVQLLLIIQLCSVCGIAADDPLLTRYILPGAAVSILLGNLFYAVQAVLLMRREQRNDVTALPYGINTVSLLVYIYFVMVPVYQQTQDPRTAWLMGLLACLGSGLIEAAGSLVADSIRKHTPRAALLSTLSGIAIGFISMTFALQIFHRPLITMLPMAIILGTYFARIRFPWGIPGGVISILAGTLCAWGLPLIFDSQLVGPPMDTQAVVAGWQNRGWYAPQFVGADVWQLLRQPANWLGYLSVIVPMGIFNVVGSLQNIESAEAAGDQYSTRWSLAANGIGTITAALFGSCFPTTIYIGHLGWKQMGARAGYSVLNGLVITVLCLTGTVSMVSALIPLEAGIAIVLWIGIIITAQAFQTTPAAHAPAVAMGLFPAIAAWGATIVHGAFITISMAQPAAPTLERLLADSPMASLQVNGFLVHGLITLERGYIFTCMFLSALTAHLIDRRFRSAAWWALTAGLFALVGLTHAYQVDGNNIDYLFALSAIADDTFGFRATGIAIGYVLMAGSFLVFERLTATTDRGPAATATARSEDDS